MLNKEQKMQLRSAIEIALNQSYDLGAQSMNIKGLDSDELRVIKSNRIQAYMKRIELFMEQL